MSRRIARALLAALSTAVFAQPQSSSCAGCHLGIYDTYRLTGMGRSFFPPRPEQMTEDWETRNTYYHQASERHYKMLRRDGRYFVRRHQADRALAQRSAVLPDRSRRVKTAITLTAP